MNSKIKRTGVVSADAGALGEKLHVHALLELEWGALDMGQPSGIEECDVCMGQLLPQQQQQAQQLMLWLLCARSDTPGTNARRIESDKAQALFWIFMPYFFIANEGEIRKAKTLAWGAPLLPFLVRCHAERPRTCGPPTELKVNLSSPPRKRGSTSVDSRFRGNAAIFDGA